MHVHEILSDHDNAQHTTEPPSPVNTNTRPKLTPILEACYTDCHRERYRYQEQPPSDHVDVLCRLAAQSIDRSLDDIVDFAKLAEGGFNRIFLISMRDGFQIVARIPYPATVPKYFSVASEVATMALLRSSGLLYQRYTDTPDTRLPLWYGRRSQLDVDRGPYESAEAALVRPAHEELAYLSSSVNRCCRSSMRREGYRYQEQPPSDHIKNLDRYLLIASSLIPKNPALGHFLIRHPDLQQSNIIVSRSPDSNWKINYDDPISQSMTLHLLPENLDELDETEQSRAKELYHRHLVHYHYVKHTEECNELHYAALTDPVGMLRRRLFYYASDRWEGETLSLKVALIEATEEWETLTGGGTPCPVVFDAEDVRETMKLDEAQRGVDETMEACQNMIGFGPEGWVPTECYEEAMRRSKQLKKDTLAAEEQAEIVAHWPLDGMDEVKYM
ncbi:hypothetical protein AX17_002811 [Amanita inopinata Kibby_2008]|nr:hypothetical protein AX17_002811 [Amanita inopinata Kibby_2008]